MTRDQLPSGGTCPLRGACETLMRQTLHTQHAMCSGWRRIAHIWLQLSTPEMLPVVPRQIRSQRFCRLAFQSPPTLQQHPSYSGRIPVVGPSASSGAELRAWPGGQHSPRPAGRPRSSDSDWTKRQSRKRRRLKRCKEQESSLRSRRSSSRPARLQLLRSAAELHSSHSIRSPEPSGSFGCFALAGVAGLCSSCAGGAGGVPKDTVTEIASWSLPQHKKKNTALIWIKSTFPTSGKSQLRLGRLHCPGSCGSGRSPSPCSRRCCPRHSALAISSKPQCLALLPRCHAAERATAIEQHHPGPKRLFQLRFDGM